MASSILLGWGDLDEGERWRVWPPPFPKCSAPITVLGLTGQVGERGESGLKQAEWWVYPEQTAPHTRPRRRHAESTRCVSPPLSLTQPLAVAILISQDAASPHLLPC